MSDEEERMQDPETLTTDPVIDEDPAGIAGRIRIARKAEMQRLEADHRLAVLALSPRCERNEPVVCRDLLAFHEPCTRCPCTEFVGDRPPRDPAADSRELGILANLAEIGRLGNDDDVGQ